MTRSEANRVSAPCICVVDDDAAVRHAVAALFDACGYVCRAFPSAEALLAWPRLDGFDLAVFDVGLPGIDGFALAGRVALRRPALPLLFISGSVDAGLRQQATAAGARALLAKPLDPERLLEQVERALAQGAAP